MAYLLIVGGIEPELTCAVEALPGEQKAAGACGDRVEGDLANDDRPSVVHLVTTLAMGHLQPTRVDADQRQE